MGKNLNKSMKFVLKNTLLFNVYYDSYISNVYMQWVDMQHIFILYNYLTENFATYSFTHVKPNQRHWQKYTCTNSGKVKTIYSISFTI